MNNEYVVHYANVVSQKCTWLLRRKSPREANELNIDGVVAELPLARHWHSLDRHGHGHFLLPLSKPDLRPHWQASGSILLVPLVL